MYPKVNHDTCIRCNLCNKVCPAQSQELKNEAHPTCYATWNKDPAIRAQSSSGGVFSLLAGRILREGGYVCGAVIESGYVRHTLISHEEQLSALRGSKYVQSDMGDCYAKIKPLLQKKKTVFFTGTPCQVAGLRDFLRKDYATLLTADVVCHGTPSPLVWQRYLSSEFGNDPIQYTHFRGKQTSWRYYNIEITSAAKHVYMPAYDHIFIKGFLSDLYLRPACYHCPYTSIPRQGDITLGDFWGIKEHAPHLDDDKGTSLILINSAAGRAAFDAIKGDLVTCEEVPLDFAKKHNPVLTRPSKEHPERYNFFRSLEMKHFDFKRNTEQILKGGAEVAILYSDWRSGFGSCLSAYALQHTIHEIGYPSKLLHFTHDTDEKPAAALAIESFAKEHIVSTEPIHSKQQAEKLNERFATFLLSSEIKVCDPKDYTSHQNTFNFVLPDKKLMAFGLSAEASWENSTPLQREAFAYGFNRFDALSTCTPALFDALPEMGLAVTKSLDALFLCDADFWVQLADSCKDSHTEPYIAGCLSSGIDQEAHNLGSHSLIDIKDASSVTHWIKLIRDCDALLCDDYHALCMAIIFQKPFIVVEGREPLSARLMNLLDFCQLSHRALPMAKITEETLYQEFPTNLRHLIEENRHFLEKHLSTACQNNRLTYAMMLNLENQRMLRGIRFKYLRLVVWKYKILVQLSWGKRRNYYKHTLAKIINMKKLL